MGVCYTNLRILQTLLAISDDNLDVFAIFVVDILNRI